MDVSKVRVYAAVAILGVATLAVAFIIVWDTISGTALPGYVQTVAGLILGFVLHELGIQSGVKLGAGASSAEMTDPANPPLDTGVTGNAQAVGE